MKRVYTVLFVLSLIVTALLISSPASAQREMPSVDERIEELNKAVDLTAEQEKKIRELYEEQANRVEEQASERRSSRRRGREGSDSGGRSGGREGGNRMGRGGRGGFGGDHMLEEILTANQMDKYREHQSQQRTERSLERYKDQLNLKADQLDEVKAILVKQSKESEKLMAGMRDMEQEDRRAMFEKFREIREGYNKEIAKVLDKEQQKKFEEMNAEMRERFRGRQ